nr:MAG TPA: hypothetical protein [Caudoviricetes sp.]
MAIRLPFWKYLHTNSACARHATMSIKSACRCSLCRAKLRSQAMRKLHTLVPCWVVLSSGSATNRPMIATTLSMNVHLFLGTVTCAGFIINVCAHQNFRAFSTGKVCCSTVLEHHFGHLGPVTAALVPPSGILCHFDGDFRTFNILAGKLIHANQAAAPRIGTFLSFHAVTSAACKLTAVVNQSLAAFAAPCRLTMHNVKILHHEQVRHAHALGHVTGNGASANVPGVGLRKHPIRQIGHCNCLRFCQLPNAFICGQALHFFCIALRTLSWCCSGDNGRGFWRRNGVHLKLLNRCFFDFIFRHGEFPPQYTLHQ